MPTRWYAVSVVLESTMKSRKGKDDVTAAPFECDDISMDEEYFLRLE
jgi:hypothetical protein